MIEANEAQASFIKNKGKISFTHLDSGIFGRVRNQGRLDAYSYAIQKHSIPTDSVVDVGCSYGAWYQNYIDLGFKEINGVDVNPDVVEEAAKLYNKVYHASASNLNQYFPSCEVIAANGLIIHLLHKKEVLNLYKGIYQSLSKSGYFLFTVVDSDHYISPNGFKPWTGDNSCTRELSYFDELLEKANLSVVDKIGTFINPWCVEEFRFLAQAKIYKEDEALYDIFRQLASFLREKNTHKLFSEILYVAKKNK